MAHISDLTLGGIDHTNHRKATAQEVADNNLTPKVEYTLSALDIFPQETVYIPRSSAQLPLHCHLKSTVTSASYPRISQWIQTLSQSALTTMPTIPSPTDLVTSLE